MNKVYPSIRITPEDDKRLVTLAARIKFARKSDLAREALRRGLDAIERETKKEKRR